MSIICNGIGVGIRRTTGGFLGGASSFDIMFKVRGPIFGESTIHLLGPSDYVGAYTSFGTLTGSGVKKLWAGTEGLLSFGDEFVGPLLQENIWFDFRITYNDSTNIISFSVNGVPVISGSQDYATTSFPQEQLGFDDATPALQIELAYYRSWNGLVLTDEEYAAERVSPVAVKATGLFCDTTLANTTTGLEDTSGNNRDWIAVGAITAGDSPTLISGAPSNVSNITALDISDEETLFQNAHDSGVTSTLWYKFTTLNDDNAIAVWAFGLLTGYTVELVIYDAPADFTDVLHVAYPGHPICFNVSPNTQYYLRVQVDGGGNPTPAICALSITRFTNEDSPSGSLFIPSDDPDFPGGIISSADGVDSLLKLVTNVANGECGDVLTASGKILLSDIDGSVHLYSPSLALLADIAVPDIHGEPEVSCIRTTKALNKFYVACGESNRNNNNGKIHTVNSDGSVGAQSWNVQTTGLFRLDAIAPSNDEKILYYRLNDGVSSPVKRWSLETDTALSDLTVASIKAKDILVLADDTIVILNQASDTLTVYRYSPAGVLLNTYDGSTYGLPDGIVTEMRISYAVDDPNSFWIYAILTPDSTYANGSVHHHINVKVSDGSQLNGINVVGGFGNKGWGGDDTPMPYFIFGLQPSCPFMVTAAEGVVAVGGIYQLTPDKRHDTLYTDVDNETTENFKIPRPFGVFPLIGN